MLFKTELFTGDHTANANKFIQVLSDQYARIGESAEDITKLLPEQTDLADNMQHGRRMYFGHYAGELGTTKKLAAVASLGDWFYGDQKPFDSPIETLRAWALHKQNIAHGKNPSRYDGIFGFGVANEFADDFSDVASNFLAQLCARSRARGKVAIRAAIGVTERDILDVFASRGSQVVSHVGAVPINSRLKRESLLYEVSTGL